MDRRLFLAKKFLYAIKRSTADRKTQVTFEICFTFNFKTIFFFIYYFGIIYRVST